MAIELKTRLCIKSKNLSLSEISLRIGEPDSGFSVGDSFLNGKKNRDHTHWSINFDDDVQPNNLDRQLEKIITYYQENRPKLDEFINSECKIYVSCYFYTENGQGGTKISESILSELGSLKVGIHFDVHAPVV